MISYNLDKDTVYCKLLITSLFFQFRVVDVRMKNEATVLTVTQCQERSRDTCVHVEMFIHFNQVLQREIQAPATPFLPLQETSALSITSEHLLSSRNLGREKQNFFCKLWLKCCPCMCGPCDETQENV